MTTAEQDEAIDLLSQIASEIEAGVKKCGEKGAPAGVLYAFCVELGCNLTQFDAIMGVLVQANRVKKRGSCYFAA
jgi:hypothetical protein